MKNARVMAVDYTLWQAIRRRARDHGLTPEAWFDAQRSRTETETGSGGAPESTEDDTLFDLTLRHFRELQLSGDEAGAISAAIQASLEHGEPSAVGPVGLTRRHYVFHRRDGALGIRIGAGGIRLPLRHAMRLATLLAGPRDTHLPVEEVQAA